MDIYKIFYYLNLLILLIETITIYLHIDNVLWLAIMLIAFGLQLLSLSVLKRKKSANKN